MSFLTILLVASAFYFAHARPDSQTWADAFAGAQANSDNGEVQDAPAGSEPITDPSDDQHKMFGLMQAVTKALDQYMPPLMSKLGVKKQDELKSMGINGIYSYFNYLVLLIEHIENEIDSGDGQADGHPLPRDEMIVEFGYDYPLAPDTLIAAI